MKKMDTEQQQTKPQNMIFILKLVMPFLLLVQEESNKHFNSTKFIYEQLNLMTWNKFDYSTVMIIFSSLLYKLKLVTIVNGDPKAPFSIATTLRYKGEHYSVPCIAKC